MVRFRLKEMLRTRLVECGWRDQLKQHCKGGRGILSPILVNKNKIKYIYFYKHFY